MAGGLEYCMKSVIKNSVCVVCRVIIQQLFHI